METPIYTDIIFAVVIVISSFTVDFLVNNSLQWISYTLTFDSGSLLIFRDNLCDFFFRLQYNQFYNLKKFLPHHFCSQVICFSAFPCVCCLLDSLLPNSKTTFSSKLLLNPTFVSENILSSIAFKIVLPTVSWEKHKFTKKITHLT